MAGFAQGFLLAGARSTLVSLWKVDDPSTAFLMNSYYDKWINANISNVESLSEAMTETRKIEEWKHTYYWGPFTLIGDVLKYK